MMGRKRIPIEVGKEYGWFTVLGDSHKDKHGHILHHVRCRCGHEQFVQTQVLQKGTAKCKRCASKYNLASERANIVGQIFEHWEVLKEIERKANGTRQFICKCRSCGDVSIKTKAQIVMRKIHHCENCPPEYNFIIKGDSAIGTLPDGSQFIIDTTDIPKVSKRWWHKNQKGYIISTLRRSRRHDIKLHDFLLNPSGLPNVVIDHINRNKADCRRKNLRLVTHQQNSMNRSIGRNNKTGYVGVFFDTSMGRYRAKIGLNNRNINLGYSDDPVECAQMYNIGTELIFREFAGHHNDVPEPSIKLRRMIAEKCLPFMAEADLATQACSLFSCQNEAVAI